MKKISLYIFLILMWSNMSFSNETDQIPNGYLDALKNGCISAAKKNNNLDKARLNYCVCYSNWFKDNLNSNEFNDFLALSVENKKKFIVKNKINTQCYKP